MSEPIERTLGRMEEKLDNLTDSFRDYKEVTEKRLDAHAARLTRGERFENRAMGAVALGVLIISIVIKMLP